MYRRALEKHGFVVETASDGETGIARAIEDPPDIILMDVVMPGVNGFQATRELHKRESTAEIPIIIITTKDQETDRIWGIRQGAVDYLVKPISKPALVKRVKAVLADAQQTKREQKQAEPADDHEQIEAYHE